MQSVNTAQHGPIPSYQWQSTLISGDSIFFFFFRKSGTTVRRRQRRLFIAGQFVEGNGEKWDVINPATKLKIASVHVAGPKEVDAAVDAAERAWPAWASINPVIRGRIMYRLADLVDENVELLGMAQSMEMGKPLDQSIGEAKEVAYGFRYFGGLADKIKGKTSLNIPGILGMEVRQPYGVTAGIIPWNSPLRMLTSKIAPALAAGNASIIKTSEKSPLSGLLFAGLAKKAGIPDGILSILSGARETGELLSSHMRIRKISFTGSVPAGKAVAQAAARSNLKPCTLELGGKSPVLVFEDCDLEDTVQKAMGGFTRNSGQLCIAGTRIYVQDTIYEKFSSKLAAALENYTIGDPNDPASKAGPQVDSFQHQRVLEYIELGKTEGNILSGGTGSAEKGYYVKPTVFTDVKDDARINKEEIFGPVTILHRFSSEEEVLNRANDTEYGLASYIFTKDISRAIRVSTALETGQVGVNTMVVVHPTLAFGGWKSSGLGRELGDHALDSYMEVKTIYMQ